MQQIRTKRNPDSRRKSCCLCWWIHPQAPITHIPWLVKRTFIHLSFPYFFWQSRRRAHQHLYPRKAHSSCIIIINMKFSIKSGNSYSGENKSGGEKVFFWEIGETFPPTWISWIPKLRRDSRIAVCSLSSTTVSPRHGESGSLTLQLGLNHFAFDVIWMNATLSSNGDDRFRRTFLGKWAKTIFHGWTGKDDLDWWRSPHSLPHSQSVTRTIINMTSEWPDAELNNIVRFNLYCEICHVSHTFVAFRFLSN